MSKATDQVKKKMHGWGAAHYITEYLPVTSGLIAAMVVNPPVWTWLIFVLFAVIIIGGLIACFKKSGKTIVWGIILILVIAVSGWVMYTIVGTCFALSAANDLIVKPKYEKMKEIYKHYTLQDQYEDTNK